MQRETKDKSRCDLGFHFHPRLRLNSVSRGGHTNTKAKKTS
jgi:hypothetical protein